MRPQAQEMAARANGCSTKMLPIALWCAGVVALVGALLLRNPLFLPWRAVAGVLLAVSTLAVLTWMGLRWHQARALYGIQTAWLLGLWLAVLVTASGQELVFQWRKHGVLSVQDASARRLGAHLIVGYSNPQAVHLLARRGLIGGIYISTHDMKGRTVDAIRAELDALQMLRRAARLPPLIVSTDQEGGIVSRMSPPLSRLPPLAEVIAGARTQDVEGLAFAYGAQHGQELARLGVNVNLAPLADLASAGDSHRLDFRSLIGRRAIDSDPIRVSAAVIGYAHGVESHGVHATLKHFPGLGRSTADTHIGPATIDTDTGVLQASDWIPFRQGLQATQSLLMVGHATLRAVDASRPASRSTRVVRRIVREQWGHDGVLVTDDLTMGAVVWQGLCPAGAEVINAGIDLLLISYDTDQYYEIFHCLLAAERRHALDPQLLEHSQRRLDRLRPTLLQANPGAG